MSYIKEKYGNLLPPKEFNSDPSQLSANIILDKIRLFYFKLNESHDGTVNDFAESEFLRLMNDYPLSMCSRELTDTLKLVIALMYYDSRIDKDKYKNAWKGYSMKNLGVIFARSKATIHEAVRSKQGEALKIIEMYKNSRSQKHDSDGKTNIKE